MQDQAAVIDLWSACGLLRPWNDPVLDILRKQSVGADLFLVGELHGRIVAAVMGGYDGHRGWMNYLAVCPDLRRQRLGEQLVQSLERRLIAIGCPKLNLQVRNDNSEVVQFYKRIGYSDDNVLSLGKRLITDKGNDR
jgi:ribosomal protein S18 acetylase RimI-like enzyme